MNRTFSPGRQATGILTKPPFNHHWVLPDVDGHLHCLDQFEVPLLHASDVPDRACSRNAGARTECRQHRTVSGSNPGGSSSVDCIVCPQRVALGQA